MFLRVLGEHFKESLNISGTIWGENNLFFGDGEYLSGNVEVGGGEFLQEILKKKSGKYAHFHGNCTQDSQFYI